MSETKACPKCGGRMTVGYLSNARQWTEGKSLWGVPKSKAYAYACQNCGYIEFYLEHKPVATREQNIVTEEGGRNRLVRQ